MSGGGAENRKANLVDMVVAYHSRYPMDKSGAYSSGDGGGYRDGGIRWRYRVGYERMEGGRMK